jgi:hypothetical protein
MADMKSMHSTTCAYVLQAAQWIITAAHFVDRGSQ